MLKIALGQMEITPGHPSLNAQKMLSMINKAKQQNAHLIIFPEMSIPGSLLGDISEQQAFLRDCEEFGKKIIEASEGIAVIFGNVAVDWRETAYNNHSPRKYNACFAAQNGSLVFPDSSEYNFCSTDKDLLNQFTLNLNGKNIKITCLIGEPTHSAPHTSPRPDLFINIASSVFEPERKKSRNRFFQEYSKNLKIPFIHVNSIGLQNNGKTFFVFDGFSSIHNFDGALTHYCQQFQEEMAVFELDLENRDVAKEMPVLEDSNIAGIFHAINYAIPKFLNSIKQNKVVIGASGGIDSAVNAALYVKAIGAENVLLVNMPSKFNSSTTKNAAKELADNLGCLYAVMPIDNSVENTVSQISKTPVICLSKGTEFYLSLTPFMIENIQARDRSSRLLAGVAAAFDAVFTCNANKSEMSVGYSTLYGDQAGFFAVLADLWKHQVYELANFLNQSVYGRQVIPQVSIDLIPSAELSYNQNVDKGQGDPFIYPYHDYLFRAFIEDSARPAPEDFLRWYIEGVLEEKIGCEKGLVNQIFKTGEEFVADLEKWWTFHTAISVAKRVQSPPVLSLSRRAYGSAFGESQNGTYYTQNYFRLKMLITK